MIDPRPLGTGGLAGKTAVVTGAASGLGAACAGMLSEAGVNVVFVDLRDVAVCDHHAGKQMSVTADVSSATDVGRVIDATMERFGSLDILVNAAGALEPTRFLDIELAEWARVLEVNATGAFLISQAAARPMVDAGWGRIVHMASTASKTVSTLGGAHYTASKHGLLGLVRASAKELAPYGVTVNAVCPGLIDTEGARTFLDKDALDEVARGFPVSRVGTPREVAALVLFLVQPHAGYITGAALDINGGDLLA